ncbi:hypothetical protein L7F22_005334 [Adiantum nelumboides]|nr:hypothetical protein [Adiantum nelumboides]
MATLTMKCFLNLLRAPGLNLYMVSRDSGDCLRPCVCTSAPALRSPEEILCLFDTLSVPFAGISNAPSPAHTAPSVHADFWALARNSCSTPSPDGIKGAQAALTILQCTKRDCSCVLSLPLTTASFQACFAAREVDVRQPAGPRASVHSHTLIMGHLQFDAFAATKALTDEAQTRPSPFISLQIEHTANATDQVITLAEDKTHDRPINGLCRTAGLTSPCV